MSIFESHEETQKRIEQEHTARLVLFCRDCQQMRRHTADSLTWHCAECGGGDLSTEQVKDDLQRALGVDQ